jgi:ABC-2 type transport system permease protein
MTVGSGALPGLQPLRETGWRSGLAGLMKAGYGAWWKTNTWWGQALLWTAILNGSTAVVLWGDAPEDLSVFSLYGVMTMFAAIAVAILMQEEIVGEKRNGTAAWVHSKPVSRPAFILSKLVPNSVGILATMLVIPSVFFYAHMLVAGIEVSPWRFALGVAVASLNLLFYVTLTLMLGTIFDGAAPVIAIPLAFAFGQQLMGTIPLLSEVLPWALVVGSGSDGSSVVAAIIEGDPIPNPGAIIFAIAACLVFTAVAFWKWNRTEL